MSQSDGLDFHPDTHDEELLTWLGPRYSSLSEAEPARLERMIEELAEGFRVLADVTKAVSVFGSSRTPPDHPDYAFTREVCSLLGRAGFAIITGGGPGLMEAANLGARTDPSDADASVSRLMAARMDPWPQATTIVTEAAPDLVVADALRSLTPA